MNTDSHEIFDTAELLTAFNLIKARCRKDGIRLALIHPPINLSPENPFPTEWSHRPQRHDPNPAVPHDHAADRENKAIAHARKLAIKWSEENDFNPPLHRELPHNVKWHIAHDPGCTYQDTDRKFCDCNYVALVRFANREFAVGEDGSLEPFTAPPPTLANLKSLKSSPPFFLDDLEGRGVRVNYLFGVATSYILVGQGDEARVLEICEDEIQERTEKQPNPNAENERYSIVTKKPR